MKNNTIRKHITIKAEPSVIFEALTTPDKIVQYFPLKEVNGKWKVNGKVQYIGEIAGVTFTDFSIIEILDNPYCFQYRYWSDNHGTDNRPENYLSIRYQLKTDKNGTQLSLTQSNIQNPDMYEQMNNIVWDYLLGALKEFVENKL